MGTTKYFLALLPFLPIIALSRPLADDFCQMQALAAHGVIGGTLNWYATWSGRYSSMFLLLAVNGFAPILAFAVLAVWGISLARLMRRLSLPVSICKVGAVTIIATLLAIAPDPYQSYFWTTDVLTYTTPMMLFTLAITLTSPALAALVIFAAAGFSDITTLLMVLCLGLAVFHQKRFALPLVAALVGLLIIIAAPGNAERTAYYPAPSVSVAIEVLQRGFGPAMLTGWTVLLGLGALAFVAGLGLDVPRLSPWCALAGPIAWATCLFVTGYFQSAPLTVRAWSVPQYASAIGVMAGAFALGQRAAS